MQCCAVMALLIMVFTVVFFFIGGGTCCSSSSSSSNSSASTITSVTGTTTSTFTSKETGMKTIGTTTAKSENDDTAQAPSFILEKEEEATLSPDIPPMDALAGSPALSPSFQQILADAAALTAGKSAAWTEGEKAGEAGHLMISTTNEEEEGEEDERVCFVGNAVELREAITHESCSLIQLAALSDGVGEEEQEQVDGREGGNGGQCYVCMVSLRGIKCRREDMRTGIYDACEGRRLYLRNGLLPPAQSKTLDTHTPHTPT